MSKDESLCDANAYPLWITTDNGKSLYVKVDRDSGKIDVGGDADATDAAKAFMEAVGHAAVVVPKGWELAPSTVSSDSAMYEDIADSSKQ